MEPTQIEARDVGDECLSTDSTLPPCTWFTHPGIEFTAGRLRSCSHRTLHQLWVREGSFWETTWLGRSLFFDLKKTYVRNNPLGPFQKVPEVRVYLRFSNSHDSGFWGFWGDSQAAYDGRFIYFGFGVVTWGNLKIKCPQCITEEGGGTPSSKGRTFSAGRFPNILERPPPNKKHSNKNTGTNTPWRWRPWARTSCPMWSGNTW